MTFESFEDGKLIFDYLIKITNSIDGLIGKMKLERVSRFFVNPEDANQLPIVKADFVQKWVKNVKVIDKA